MDEKVVTQTSIDRQLLESTETQHAVATILRQALEDQPLEDMLDHVLDAVVKLSWVASTPKGVIFVLDQDADVLRMKASVGIAPPQREMCALVHLGQCLCGAVAATGQAITASHVDDQHSLSYDGMADHGHCCVPIRHGDQVLGVLNVYLDAGDVPDQLASLRAIADAVAGILVRRRSDEERIAVQHQYLHAQRLEAVGRLAGSVAHDFNNLLTVVEGYSGFLIEQLREGDPAREDARTIQEAGRKAATLTRQLLAFSKREIQQLEMLCLDDVVRDLSGMLGRLIGEDVEMGYNLDCTELQIYGDRGQIEQVLMNLLVNARDAMPEGGSLSVNLEPVRLKQPRREREFVVAPGVYAQLTVVDTGVGMSEKVRDQAFEPFFTTKSEGKGTGLGLSTIFGIVKQHKGYIRIDSEVGVGTTVRILLPQGKSTAKPSKLRAIQPGTSSPPKRSHETVLVVEDEAGVRQAVVRMLRKQGYEVIEASDGEEAVLLCEKRDAVHLVLTDMVMPMMTGAELCQQLRARHPQIKAVIMSGYHDEQMTRVDELPADTPFLQKPFTMEFVLDAVRTTLDGDN